MSSIVDNYEMFEAIQKHCDAMNPIKFYTNRDIVDALHGLDLGKYLSLSNDPAIWWSEIEPVLDFFFWLKDIEVSVSGCSPINLCFCHD